MFSIGFKEVSIMIQNKVFWLITIALVSIAFTYVYFQNNWIEVEHIAVKIKDLPNDLKGLKIAHISDVHIPQNASSIPQLIEKVKGQNPDIIVLTGDIIDKRSKLNEKELKNLCKGLSAIANTYAVRGNHEDWSGHLEEWKSILRENHIKIIENKFETYQRGNASLALMGLEDGERYSPDIFKGIESLNNMPKILLAHHPELFYTYVSDSYNITPDVIFSGHAHGGQFRIPIINKGILSPDQGLFPTFTSGIYTSDNGKQMIVSRGLGNSIFPIRMNNRPHLPIITLQ